MSSQFRLPPLVAGNHEWRVSEHDTEILERRAVGAEVPNGTGELTRDGANDLYIWVTVQFREPSTTLVGLQEKLREVLILLRSQHPEIGCTYRWNGDNSPFIQYRSLKNVQEAVSWADQILHVRIGTGTGLHVRDQIQAERQGNEAPRPLDIYLVASISDIDVALGNTKVELVFRTNHLSSDGISIRLVVGDILRMLGSSTLSDDFRNIAWGDEHKNLAPPLFSVIGDNQTMSGQEFETSSAAYMESVRRIMRLKSTWKLKPKPGRASPRTIFHTFSLEESDRMIGAVKTRIGRTFSITHLGHAAVLLAFLKYNPPGEDVPNDQCCVVRSPMNARRFLQEQYAKEGKAYYPICLAMAPIVYEDIKSYNVLSASQDQIIENLVKVCKVTKETYDKWLKLPSLVPLSVSFFHLAASLISSNATPPPTSPFFVSDGINEKYIPREVKSEDKEIITVQEIRFFTNMYLNLLVFRLESWRDRLTLSLNYNDGNYTEVEAAEFMQNVVNFMLAICQ